MNLCLCVQVRAHRPALLSGVPEGQAAQRSAPVLVRVKGQYTFLSLSATERAWSFLGFNQWRLFLLIFVMTLPALSISLVHMLRPNVHYMLVIQYIAVEYKWKSIIMGNDSLNVLKHVEGT